MKIAVIITMILFVIGVSPVIFHAFYGIWYGSKHWFKKEDSFGGKTFKHKD